MACTQAMNLAQLVTHSLPLLRSCSLTAIIVLKQTQNMHNVSFRKRWKQKIGCVRTDFTTVVDSAAYLADTTAWLPRSLLEKPSEIPICWTLGLFLLAIWRWWEYQNQQSNSNINQDRWAVAEETIFQVEFFPFKQFVYRRERPSS